MGLELEAFREQVGATQHEVADATGLTQPTISRIEKKKQRPSSVAYLAIQEWAEDLAHSRRLPVRRRLTWGWLTE